MTRERAPRWPWVVIALAIGVVAAVWYLRPAPRRSADEARAHVPATISDVSHQRLFLIRPDGPLHVGQVAVPGYYTAVVFSASWCGPCTELRRRMPGWLDAYDNLIIVDIDMGEGSSTEGGSLLSAYGRAIQLPAMMLFTPHGLFLRSGPPAADGMPGPPPAAGPEEIGKILDGLHQRPTRRILDMHGERVMADLRAMQQHTTHYALHRSGG